MTIKRPSAALIKLASIKLATFACLVIWGLILWNDLPDALSYISILYGMAVQLWLGCVVGIIFGLSKRTHTICSHTECVLHPVYRSRKQNEETDKNPQ